MRDWFRGWYETIHMFLFDRDTYNYLKNYEIEPADFVEVDRLDEYGYDGDFR